MHKMLFDNKSECCGCWACANICPKQAIEMTVDREGFKFPIINDDLCVNCEMCYKVCPIKNTKKEETKNNLKKHIGIINLQYTQNYGAVIAACVLENVVKNIVGEGYIVNTINYSPEKEFSTRIARYKDEIKHCGGLKLYTKIKINNLKKSDTVSNEQQNGLTRNQKFDVFKDTFLNLTKIFNDAYEINKDVNYSAFITGSDIVWGPKRTDNFRAEGYYLKFANKGETKIAYAPSLDNIVNKKLKKLSKYYKHNLVYIDYVSVREKSSVDFIQSLTDKKVYHCADPTFLVNVDYYNDMINFAQIENKNDKYIYVYILEFNNDIVEYANKLAKEKNLKIYYYSSNHNNFEGQTENCCADGPSEFLYRLKNAEYVLTNSFHCVIFSLLFKKQFLSFQRSEVSIKSIELLELFDLTNRIVSNDSYVDIDDEIEFDKVNDKIDCIRNESIDYLKNALKNIK